MKTEIQYGILHNRKTAGTALKAILQQQAAINPLTNVMCFEHSMTFPRFVKEYPTAQAIFFIREPISRFVSGFYSRFRQGLPRYHHPWNKAEAKAFARFTTPNQLAESLSSLNFLKRLHAISAMKSIGHVRHTYLEFLGSSAFLEKHIARIAYIGHQVEFDFDLIKLRALLNIDDSISIPNDDVSLHRNPTNVDKYLSLKATKNLERWYKDDFAIYEWCLSKRASTQFIKTPSP